MNDWSLIESGIVFILIIGIPCIIGISGIIWNVYKYIKWFITRIFEGIVWNIEYRYGIKRKYKRRRK